MPVHSLHSKPVNEQKYSHSHMTVGAEQAHCVGPTTVRLLTIHELLLADDVLRLRGGSGTHIFCVAFSTLTLSITQSALVIFLHVIFHIPNLCYLAGRALQW